MDGNTIDVVYKRNSSSLLDFTKQAKKGKSDTGVAEVQVSSTLLQYLSSYGTVSVSYCCLLLEILLELGALAHSSSACINRNQVG